MKTARQANLDDLAAIKELVSRTLLCCVVQDEDSYKTIFDDICEIIDSWIVNSDDSVFLVCERDGEIVGVVLISQYERMNLLFVDPAHQGSGIGTSLVDSAIEACRSAGKNKRITLNSSNFAAPFYEKYGFIRNGSPRDLPGGCVPFIFEL